MSSRHPELAAFFDRVGDAAAASTWARDATAGARELVHMPAGRGGGFREDSRHDRYRCVLPSCDEPLTVSAGLQLRHHWRHRGPVSAEHTPETIWHQTAKAALAAFARAARPDAEVLVDERRTSSGAQPDVWVQHPDGDVAFEAQYSEITSTSVAERSARYERDAIAAVWLFAHHSTPGLVSRLRAAGATGAVPTTDGPDPAHPPEVRLRAGHRAAAAVGPLRWLNPDQRSVATAYVRTVERPDEHRGETWTARVLERIEYVRHATPSDQLVSLAVDLLADCTLDERGFRTPTDQWITDAAAAAAEREHRAARLHALSSPPREDRNEQRDLPNPLMATVQQRREDVADPESRPRRVYKPGGRSSPCCGAEPVAQRGWPDWYRPPQDTTAVYVCAACGIPLGSTNG